MTPIDYTNLGFDSLREAMLAQARRSVPEWTDVTPNDLGVLLIELMAHACDITLYYQTRIAANLFPATADEPDALLQLLRFIGYELRPPAPATVNLRLGFDAGEPTPIVLPVGARFFATVPGGQQVLFETERELRIQAAQLTPPDAANIRFFYPVPAVQGETVLDEAVGAADGSPNQLYPLQRGPVIPGSVRVRVTEPGAIVTRWEEVPTLADSSPADRQFMSQRDGRGMVTLLFGDNVNGMAPPRGTLATLVTIHADYRVGGGPAGNLPGGTLFAPAQPAAGAAMPNISSAVNPQAAAGGTEAEDIQRAGRLAPRLFRTQERAVTVEDYTDLALQVPGVGKARAVSVGGSQVALYIAPAGIVGAPSELLTRDLMAFFESRRIATTLLRIVAPRPADVYLRAVVRAQPYFLQSDVRAAVEAAVVAYLDFDAVEFGQPVYLSKVYDVIQSLPQVASLTVTVFSRSPYAPVLPDVDADGIIELAADELPRPGYRDNPETPPNPSDLTYRPPIDLTIEGGAA